MAARIPSLPVSGDLVLEGGEPVVILGANGSGKTRLAVSLAADRKNRATIIKALRTIDVPEQLSIQPPAEAEVNLVRQWSRTKESWKQSDDIRALFIKLHSEHMIEGDLYRRGEIEDRRPTKLEKVQQVFEDMFPGRNICVDKDFRLKASIADASGKTTTYQASQMSDGERTAIYLAARVIDAPEGTVLVDEPETHFHSLLAVRFWDRLERLRTDCRFVYLTHSLEFALSRSGARVIALVADGPPRVVDVDQEWPADLARSILSAASLTRHVSRVIFCEGERGGFDDQLYSAWFNDADTAVLPVGSCASVLRNVQALRASKLVSGLTVLGIIDRDHHPEGYLKKARPGVCLLPLHEIESLFCLEGIYRALVEHVAVRWGRRAQPYKEAIRACLESLGGDKDLLVHLAHVRYRHRCSHEFESALASMKHPDSLDIASHDPPDTAGWASAPSDIWRDEKERILAALEEPVLALQFLPGKRMIINLAKELGLSSRHLVDLVCTALVPDGLGSLSRLGEACVEALQEHLPKRTSSFTW